MQAPSGTSLEVPIVEEEGESLIYAAGDRKRLHKRKFQMHLKSRSGPITVSLVNRDELTLKPVVTTVPPEATAYDPNEATKADAIEAGMHYALTLCFN